MGVILLLPLCWLCAYWITEWVCTLLQVTLHDLTRQLIISSLGFFIFLGLIFMVSRIPLIKARQEQFVLPLIHAMKMMAQGNFNIDLSFYKKQFGDFNNEDHPYYKIIHNISHMADKLGEMEEIRQEFISNVSHEIQSPLTSIRGFAHTLRNDHLTKEERDHYLKIIEKESVRLSKLSENLLKLTSLEAKHVQLEKRKYRLDHQLRRIILANEPQWSEKMINMDISLDNITVTADEDMMEQVWTNLIHNSIKFTPHNGTIDVKAFLSEQGHATVVIRDTGIGIDKEALTHIFERFYKADKSRNREAGGNGLGLSIVKKILELHNSKISAKSEKGKGTEMMVLMIT
ncbi:two-component sensor histidine kinase [Bacillus sp. 7504-2]|nr:two-component sensor histidine kinase [Bacillus sp. 7504-2]